MHFSISLNDVSENTQRGLKQSPQNKTARTFPLCESNFRFALSTSSPSEDFVDFNEGLSFSSGVVP